MITTHYTTFGDATVEFTTIVDGAGDTSIAVSVLPSDKGTDTQPLDLATSAPMDADIPADIPAVEEAPRRGLRAFIRGMWTFFIAMFVEGGGYLVSNLTSVHIPPGVGLAGGALLQGAIYAAKKYVAPDTLL